MIKIHNVGDTVWWIGCNNGHQVPAMDTVKEVHINKDGFVCYTLDDYGNIGPDAVFGTKHDAEEYCVAEFIEFIEKDEEFNDMLKRYGIVLDSKQDNKHQGLDIVCPTCFHKTCEAVDLGDEEDSDGTYSNWRVVCNTCGRRTTDMNSCRDAVEVFLGTDDNGLFEHDIALIRVSDVPKAYEKVIKDFNIMVSR